jgi:hypothetical protein
MSSSVYLTKSRYAAVTPAQPEGPAASVRDYCSGAYTYHRRRRHHLPPGVPHGPGGHRVEAVECALGVWPLPRLDQGQEPGQPGNDQSAGGQMVIGNAAG